MKYQKEFKSLTIKQLDFIEKLEEQKEIHRLTLLKMASQVANRKISRIGELSIQEASQLIEIMKEIE